MTLEDSSDRRRYLNSRATLEQLLSYGVVPIVNENDTVATDEIRFGDNDRLAARVAQAAGADHVLLLSDIDGLYDRSPDSTDKDQLISTVEQVDEHILAMADGSSSSGLGSGGMTSKLEAAQIANMAGIALSIISGREDHPLECYETSGKGTYFQASEGNNARKNWLGGRLTSAGTIIVDEGAAAALRDGGSLLAAGIVSVTDRFTRSDVVDIAASNGQVIARGLAEYDAKDVAKIIGRRSSELAELLGYAPRSAVVHRNQMVLADGAGLKRGKSR